MSYRGRGNSFRGSNPRRGGWNEDRGRSNNRSGGGYYRESSSSRGSSRGNPRGSSSYRGGYNNDRDKFSNYHGESSHYSARGRQHDSYQHKRERSHQRGSTPERKRMRTDTYNSMGSSHGRDESYSRRGGYGESSNDRVVFREERHSTRGDHRRSSEYPPYHKPGPSHSDTAPRFKSPRGARGARGGSSFRGQSSNFRGAPRTSYVKSISTKAPVFTKRPRNDYSSRGRSSVKLRSKYESLKIELLKYKRLKLQQIQRRKAFLAKRRTPKTEDSGDEKKEEAIEGDENEEEEVEEEVEVEVEEEEEEEEVEESETKKEVEEEEGGNEGAEEAEKTETAKSDKEEKPKVKKVVKKVVKKLVKKPVKKITVNGKVADSKDGDEAEASTSEKKPSKEDLEKRITAQGKTFIRLDCPQCEVRYVTFRDYDQHLRSSKHKMAMRNRAFELKKKLAKLRMKQREEQRDIDAQVESEGGILKTSFCVSCKLNYKQKREAHNDSELHKKTKILLNPYCVPCRQRFKTPMSYEAHIALLDHIQRKAKHESYEEKVKAKKEKEQEEGKDVNMDNFMVLDSVGSGDESGEETEEKGESKDPAKEGEEDEKKKKKSKTVNLGGEYCKKITVYYCELCCMQVPRSNNLENALALHCRNRFHLKKYIRARDDRALRKKAEKIHKESQDEKKDKKVVDIKKEKPDSDERPIKQEEECDSEAEGKFWKEIESDLPDISDDLGIGGNKSSDDEDDCNGRYDRFNTKDDDKPIKSETCDVVEKDASEEPTAEESKEENESKETKEEA